LNKSKIKKNCEKNTEKQKLIEEVHALIQKGLTKRKISKVLRIARGTVYRYSSGTPEFLAANSRVAFIKLEPFQEEIISLINNKIMRKDVYYYITKKGYKGGRTQFYKYCEHLVEIEMVDLPGNLKIDEFRDEMTKLKYHYVTRNQIFHYIWNGEDKSDIEKDDIEYIKNLFPIVQYLIECLCQFRNIFEKKNKELLLEYITTYKDCSLSPIKRFIEGLQKDITAVINAVVEEYSNGFVEGTINKLKIIKRIAYGRCKLPLLKSKILLPTFF